MPEILHGPGLFGLILLVMPFGLVLLLGLASLVGYQLGESLISRLVQLTCVVGLLAGLGMLAWMLTEGTRYVPLELGHWVEIPHFHFSLKFIFDPLSIPFMLLSFALCGVIGAFTTNYLHREPGFNRFFFCFSLFLLGMVMTSLAGTIETLFAGWELVGVSSALLVAFFQERASPVRNGLHVWTVYRISDAALLIAAVAMHHLRGEGDFAGLLGAGPWPAGHANVTHTQALVVGLLLLVAVAGKSALVPFSGWLPRAMEGPTPSSAIYYGALSVHLGAFLLLRVSPLLDVSVWLSAAVVVLGLLTAIVAALSCRAQTDIKSALSYASLTQVGLIVAEIGLGLRYLPLIHIIGHACLRTLQFLRASSVLHDYRTLENAMGVRPVARDTVGQLLTPGLKSWLYRLAIERGYFDALLKDYIATPCLRLFTWCDSLERRWTDMLSGTPSRESDALPPSAGSLEDLS